ncbi:hypothetical protein TrCOL_g10234 [Triparma columacea]|nr:hypothetical protein TrCOL_g10234 [Triparma columacea]
MQPPRVTTPKEKISPKAKPGLYLNTYTAPQGVKERTGSFSPKHGGEAASIGSFASSRSPLPSPRGGVGGGSSSHGGNSYEGHRSRNQQHHGFGVSSPQSPKHPKPMKSQPRSTQRKRLTPSPGQTAMMMMNKISSHSPKGTSSVVGVRPSSASRAINAPPTTSTDVINSYIASSLSNAGSPTTMGATWAKNSEDSQLKSQMTKYRELSQIERDIARREAKEEEKANEKRYMNNKGGGKDGGRGGGIGGKDKDKEGGGNGEEKKNNDDKNNKKPSGDSKLYEFWWEEDQKEQQNQMPTKVVDDFHLRRKGGKLVVEGEEEEDEGGVSTRVNEDDENPTGGEEMSRDNMWLTTSELLLNHTKEMQAQREEMIPDLPEKKEEMLKLNTLQWLTVRGKGAKMGERMEQEKMLRDWFEALDADGSGDISVDELEEPLISIGLVSSKEDLEEMIRKYDSSGDGEIDFQEFVKMVMTREEGGKPNAMLKLFEDFSNGLLGNRLLPFSTLIHMYSRKQLFNAIMASNAEEKAEGMQVLKARIKRTEALEYDLAQEKKEEEEKMLHKRASMKVQLKMQSTADLEADVDKTLGMSSRFTKEEIRLRRQSMRRSSIARRASIVDSMSGAAGGG